MNPAITFRKATSDDASTLADARARFVLELSGEQPAEAIEALRKQMTAYFSKATRDNTCMSILAGCEGIVTGIGSVRLYHEYVHHSGITAFELHAAEAGKPVYLKAGFQIHHEPTLRNFTKHGGD